MEKKTVEKFPFLVFQKHFHVSIDKKKLIFLCKHLICPQEEISLQSISIVTERQFFQKIILIIC